MAHVRAPRSLLSLPLSRLPLPWVLCIFHALPRTGSLPSRALTIVPAELLVRSALDIVVSDFKQEVLNPGSVTRSNIQPQRSGDAPSIPNLIRRSVRNDAIPFPGVPSLASSVRSDAASANGRIISRARWNSHYLIPLASAGNSIDSTPISSFIAPDWVLVTGQAPSSAPAPGAVVGRYAFAVYDEGGLVDMNLGGFPAYANLTRPTQPIRRLRPKYPSEESEIMQVDCSSKLYAGSYQRNFGHGSPVLTSV